MHSGVTKEKPDDLLFAMDFGGDDVIERREAKTLKPLKSDEILAARSAIPAVVTRKRIGAVTDGVIVKKAKRKDGVSFAQLQRLRQIAYGGASRAPGPELVSEKKNVPDYDPWGDEAADKFKKKSELELEKLDFVDKTQKPKAPVTLKHKPIALAAIGSVPAVRLPEGGVSYNPDFEMWDRLLRENGEKEVELEKKRLVEEAEGARIQALIDAPDVEMVSATEGWEDSDESEDEDGEGENKESAGKKEAKRKTQSQKNKALKQKELERHRVEAKKLKQQERELLLVKKYAREIKLHEKLLPYAVLWGVEKEWSRQLQVDYSALGENPSWLNNDLSSINLGNLVSSFTSSSTSSVRPIVTTSSSSGGSSWSSGGGFSGGGGGGGGGGGR